MSLELLVFVGMCVVVVFYFLKMRESASEVGGNAFGIEVKAGRGARCELVDCSHNIGAQLSARALRVGSGKDYAEVEKIEVYEGACSIESHPEPVLDVVDFVGYCPEYDGGKFPGVVDVSRKGKTRWDSFMQRNPVWLMDRGGPFKNEVKLLDASKLITRVHGEFWVWADSEESEEAYLKHVKQVEAEAREKKEKDQRRE